MTIRNGYLKTPCSCGGTNENCYKCGGWGYIDPVGQGRRSLFPNGLGSAWTSQQVPERVSSSPTNRPPERRIQRCPICKGWVDDLMGHISKQHHQPGFQRVQCEHCRAMVRQMHMARHLRKVHHLTIPIASSLMPSATGTVGQSVRQQFDIRHSINESAFDATREYPASYRDHGQFGSFPSHDDFDEESKA